MPTILNIETSTTVCSASISKKDTVLNTLESFDDKSHASTLTTFIEQLLKNNSINCSELDSIAISEGPGSYTGLRIGTSVAKGICYATQKPLIAVNTLKTMAIMAIQSINNLDKKALLCPMIDARRMEVYTSIFDTKLNELQPTSAEIIDENSYSQILDNQKIYFFGNGADKLKNTITHKNAIFIENIYASAKYMASLSSKAFLSKNFKDVAYFEPYYLKNFVATKSKKNLLNT